jgi:hypothetical protein
VGRVHGAGFDPQLVGFDERDQLGDERQKGGQCEGRMSVEKGATVEERSEPRGLVMSTSLLGGSKDVDGGAVRIDSAKGAG